MSFSTWTHDDAWTRDNGESKAVEEPVDCHGSSKDFQRLNIVVQNPHKIYTIDYEPTMTIEQLKQNILENSGIAPDNQRIICGGEQLNNDTETLEERNIKKGATVTVMAKQ